MTVVDIHTHFFAESWPDLDARLGQGRENSKVFLKENPDLAEEIRTAVMAKVEAKDAGV